MDLHIPTLLVVSVFVFILMGLLTCHAWWRETRERPLAYLGAMMLLAALGVVLVSWRGRGVDVIPLVFGNVALLLSAAMNWTAMRVFVGRPPSLPGVFAGAGIWLILCLIPAFYDAMPVRVVVYSLLAAGYGVLTASEFWRSRKKLEVAYMPALVLTLLHTAFYIVRSVIDKSLPLDQALSGIGDGVRFFSFMLFESMLYVIGIAYVTLAMVKERAELKFKAAAFCDPLTGIGNRRAFMSHGEQLLTHCKRRAEPVALLLCDLDHFKRLNDSFGHPMGDQALIAFSRILTGNLRNHDVFGRIGGEEFACLLNGADEQEAVQVAERIRQAFSRLSLLEPGILSVSIGVVTTGESGYELSNLLSQADEALYGAKDHGRNRVQTLRKLYLNLTDS
jgi:diguanylate cyclase (GGDEF)-like protein